MKNIRLILAYDGTTFLGWQDAQEGCTIEGELKKVLKQILQEPLVLQAASRTDAGVHAEGQVVNFLTQKEGLDLARLKISLNQMLPKTIRIWELDEVAADFHPTLDAHSKEYHYFLTTTQVQLPFERHYAWHIYQPLDKEKMQQATQFFIGEHDFSTFCNFCDPRPKDTIRILYRFDLIEDSATGLQFKLHGNNFLYKMVRNLVGTIVDVGLGKLSLEKAALLLKKKERTEAGVTAPAHGLLLKKVYYSYNDRK